MNILLGKSKSLLLCLTCKSKISFSSETVKQSLLESLVLLVNSEFKSNDFKEIGKVCS